ncbi:MAG: hypothetical protein BWZ10_02608 [candidate division BRC1 bacterium ADurb.BinA364]|nr:MAG: hypothetical protein BWZ10_02608 [candidate division BRC1 bacterium ADurb.BinA364]
MAGGRAVAGQLHEEEGEIPLAPGLAPAFDHRREKLAVLDRAACVGFALIPDGAGDGVGLQRRDHRVVQGPRPFHVVRPHRRLRRLGRGLAFGLGFDHGLLVLFLPRFEGFQGLRMGGERFFVFLDVVAEFGRGFHDRALDPARHIGAADAGLNQADGGVAGLLQGLAEVIADSGKRAHGLRAAFAPGSLDIVLRLVGARLRRLEQANVGIGRLRDGLAGIERVGDRPDHVGLTAAQPDFAHQHIADDDFILAFDRHLERAARLERRQLGHPLAVDGFGRGRDALDRNRHRFPFAGPAPDRRRHALLKDHVVGKQRVEPDIRASGRRGEDGRKGRRYPQRFWASLHGSRSFP